MSTDRGCVAAIDGAGLMMEEVIPGTVRGWGNGIPEIIERIRQRAGWSWEQVDLFAAGRGPGRYSGMRAALTTMQVLALPGATPVRAVSSGRVLVQAAGAERPEQDRIMIVGDARRERVWLGLFERTAGDWTQTLDWRLATVREWAALSDDHVLCVSSEWSRLEPMLREKQAPARNWIERDIFPSAIDLARIAQKLEKINAPREEPLPIYLHPPVAIPPRSAP
jgi:tRNA threonylcarbamoyl adenosine modification protein YeaZ